MVIPRIDANLLEARDPDAIEAMRRAATDTGFATVYGTALDADRVGEVIETYRAFFLRPTEEKARIDMARTGANRGWGGPASEQVDPDANPDFKQYFDCGFTLPDDHPLSRMPVYAPNLWPRAPASFERVIKAYYDDALEVAKSLLRAVSLSLGKPAEAFDRAFEAPMALLRGNYYPPRPDTAGDKDFGIATHTDYGCITLLATDGSPGLEVRQRGGGWIPLSAPPGEFVINFGEMLQFWTAGDVVATPHRVKGGLAERISVPLFVNPSHDTNLAPPGTDRTILAGDHMARRFSETYVHLKTG